jgi:predicted amino acid racemase
LKTGAPEKSVLDWVTAADRMRVKGVGWEYAELLRAAGVRTVNELRFRNPNKLADAMVEINTKRKLVRILPSVNTVMRWIEDAKKLPPVICY